MPYKVIQWSTGYTGTFALRYILNNPALQLVGLKCFSKEKEGQDAGTIAGMSPMGVRASCDTEALLALDADCVLHMPGDPDLAEPFKRGTRSFEIFEALIPILESGKNVVSIHTTLSGLKFAGPEGIQCFERLEQACKKGQSTFFATGYDPGFMTDLVPLCLTSACAEVHSVRSFEILDYSDYDALDSLKKIGLCMMPEDMPREAPYSLMAIWRSVIHFVAIGIGAALEDVRVNADFRVTDETYTTHRGITLQKGCIEATRFSLEGIVNGEPVIALEHVSRMRDGIAPEWVTLPPRGGYRIEIEGSNPVHAEFHLGLPSGNGNGFADAMSATAARAVNAVPFVCEASVGVKDFFDLPMITGRHSFRAKPNNMPIAR